MLYLKWKYLQELVNTFEKYRSATLCTTYNYRLLEVNSRSFMWHSRQFWNFCTLKNPFALDVSIMWYCCIRLQCCDSVATDASATVQLLKKFKSTAVYLFVSLWLNLLSHSRNLFPRLLRALGESNLITKS